MNISLKGLRFALAAVIVAFAGHAQALLLGPGDADWTTDGNSNLSTGTAVAGIVGTSSTLELYYKSDFGGGEAGSFTDSYNTVFSGDPNDALITYTGGESIICPECYLIVKDGNEPQYLFDLASWDGMEELDLQGFYPNQGAISNVAIWGNANGDVSVPEPSALILMGLGLIGLGMARRRVAR